MVIGEGMDLLGKLNTGKGLENVRCLRVSDPCRLSHKQTQRS
jgi:hypothetical protein